MRRWLNFDCEGAQCAATLDTGDADVGLLIVSGGNEVRSGAHRGMAWLAADIAASGYPVLRYDRRGIGDSDGSNLGFRSSAPDIEAATVLLREQTGVQSVAAFGNCDAATALALFGARAGIDALLLANPWTFDDEVDGGGDQSPALPPASAIRARYLARLRDPRQIWRLISGGVDYRKLLGGLRAAHGNSSTPAGLATELINALASTPLPITILLADQDRTAMAFADVWRHAAAAAAKGRISCKTIASGSHSFADTQARRWLSDQIIDMLMRTARPSRPASPELIGL